MQTKIDDFSADFLYLDYPLPFVRGHLAALVVLVLGASLLQSAYSLTPRDFSYLHDNHYTYFHPGSTMICGDHICKPGEWDTWIGKLMVDQMKGKAPSNVTTTSTKEGVLGTPIIMNLGTGWYSTILPLTYSGTNPIHHITLVLNGGKELNIRSAYITDQWTSSIGSSAVTFDTASVQVIKGQTVVMVMETDARPSSFELGSLS